MIQKSNGTSTYGTRDLAGIKYRMKEFNLDRLIIEIGNEQQLYFKQIITAAEMLGWVKPGQLTHVGHGLFMLPSGKMSTRKGETVWVSDLINELEQKAGEIVSRRTDLLENEQKEAVSAIAIGALKYNDLSQNRLGNVVFDKEKSLALDGNSAPYIQYTIARSKSVLRSASGVNLNDVAALASKAQSRNTAFEPIEREMLTLLAQFDEVVQDTSHNLLPNTLTSYLFNLGQKYNSFYQSCPILNSKQDVKESRLCIVIMTINILTAGLAMLGIKSVEKM
jgi:arginyl-tRNA synthetase